MEIMNALRGGEVQELTEAIYDAAVDPNGWGFVMRSLKAMFRTGAETLYFLDYRKQTKKYVHIEGISSSFMKAFPETFYTPDNPCLHSPQLHRPGVLRTDTILCEHLGDRNVLARSCYFNEWMRPQGLEHSMGTTPLAQDGRVLNLSLLRSARTGPFDSAELRRFAHVARLLRHAMKIASRLDTLGASAGAAAEALDRLAHGAVLLDERNCVQQANTAAERLLRRDIGLTVHGRRLRVADPTARLALSQLFAVLGQAGGKPPVPVIVPLADGARRIIINGVRLSGQGGLWGRPAILLLLVDPDTRSTDMADLLHRLYGCNRSEQRLVLALLDGNSLRQAGDAAGISYETARWYLKGLFQKTGSSRQGELIAKVLRDVNAATMLHADPLWHH